MRLRSGATTIFKRAVSKPRTLRSPRATKIAKSKEPQKIDIHQTSLTLHLTRRQIAQLEDLKLRSKRVFDTRESNLTYTRLPILKTSSSIFRAYLTLRWIPPPEQDALTDHLHELLDLVRSSTEETETLIFEIFGNFLLQDNTSKELSISHGHRVISDVSITSGFRDPADFSVEVSRSSHISDLAAGLLDGRYTRHFERIFEDSSRSIVALLQVVVCCDKLTLKQQWIQKPGQFYTKIAKK